MSREFMAGRMDAVQSQRIADAQYIRGEFRIELANAYRTQLSRTHRCMLAKSHPDC